MDEFKLKLILSVLGGIVFSLIFILLAFVLPIPKEEKIFIKKRANKLEAVSHSFKQRVEGD